MFCVLGFLLILILLGAFLAFNSLGAGSGKRTRKPLDGLLACGRGAAAPDRRAVFKYGTCAAVRGQKKFK
jgi:hypothetical protein